MPLLPILLLGVVMLTLWKAGPGARPFDRVEHIGLHHFALRVDRDRFEAVYDSVTGRADVEVEFAPCDLGQGRHCMLRIPGGVRMELAWTP